MPGHNVIHLNHCTIKKNLMTRKPQVLFRKSATACSPNEESRKARNKNPAPPNGVGVKNTAIPSTTSTTEAAVSRNEPTEKRNFIMAVNRISDRTKGSINTLQSIFIIFISEISFIISTSILPCTPGDKKDAND